MMFLEQSDIDLEYIDDALCCVNETINVKHKNK